MSNLYEEHKKLAARVQELEDTIFKMKKYYEDALQNLSDDNFSASFVSEKRGMKSQISMTAEAIKTMVTNDDFTSRIEQTASWIRSEVASVEGDLNSSITQTATEITQKVEEKAREFDGKISEIKQTADGITALAERVGANEKAIGEFELTADGISTSVKKIFTDVVVLDEEWNSNDKDESKMYQVRGGSYYYYSGSGWVEVDSPTILSLFQQTANGFKLIGDFSTTTHEDTTVSISGTRIDVRNNNNLPKMSMGVSKEGTYPVIVMGAGDADGHSIKLDDITIYQGQGVILKDSDAFEIKYYAFPKHCQNSGETVPGIYIQRNSPTSTTAMKLCADEIYFDGEVKGLKVAFG